MGQEFEGSLAGWPALGDSQEVAEHMPARAASPGGSAGLEEPLQVSSLVCVRILIMQQPVFPRESEEEATCLSGLGLGSDTLSPLARVIGHMDLLWPREGGDRSGA